MKIRHILDCPELSDMEARVSLSFAIRGKRHEEEDEEDEEAEPAAAAAARKSRLPSSLNSKQKRHVEGGKLL